MSPVFRSTAKPTLKELAVNHKSVLSVNEHSASVKNQRISTSETSGSYEVRNRPNFCPPPVSIKDLELCRFAQRFGTLPFRSKIWSSAVSHNKHTRNGLGIKIGKVLQNASDRVHLEALRDDALRSQPPSSAGIVQASRETEQPSSSLRTPDTNCPRSGSLEAPPSRCSCPRPMCDYVQA